MNMKRSLRRLATEIMAAAKPSAWLGYATGQVVDVTNGIVTVATLGVEQQISHLGPTPTPGATVAVLFIAGSPLILGTISGVPTF